MPSLSVITNGGNTVVPIPLADDFTAIPGNGFPLLSSSVTIASAGDGVIVADEGSTVNVGDVVTRPSFLYNVNLACKKAYNV